MSQKWDTRFFELAEFVSKWSKDPRTVVGAVVVNDHKQVIGLGFNGFPRGVEDLEHRYHDRPTKQLFVSHAEQNALDSCFSDPRGATLYSSLYPCYHCAKSIIQRGIKRVVTVQPSFEGAPHHFDVSRTMFNESGVDVWYHK